MANLLVMKILYFPLLFIQFFIFSLLNIALMPFAYLKALIHKCLLYKKRPKLQLLANIIKFLFFGPFTFLILGITDTVNFVAHAYDFKEKSASNFTISLAAFNKFYDIIKAVDEA
jgi:hypothetical protein